MADQEAVTQLTDDKPNQVSIGLIQTPEHKMVTYLLETGNPEIDAAALCSAEPDPDYLPLVGLRTRRLGEEYPYPAIQGFRSGQEVTVVVYMQKETARPLPPPARVIVYMQSFQDVSGVNSSIIIENGLLKVGISGIGTLGFDSGLYLPEEERFGITYNGFEVLGQGDNFSTISWRIDSVNIDYFLNYEDYSNLEEDDTWASFQGLTSESSAIQVIDNDSSALNSIVPPSPVEVSTAYSISSDDILTRTTTIKNTTGSDISDLFFMTSEDFDPDRDGGVGETYSTWNRRVSNDLVISYADRNPVAIGVFCNDPIAHQCKKTGWIIGAETGWSHPSPIGSTTYFDDTIGTVFKIPSIPSGESVTITSYLIFAATEADVITKAGTL